MSTFTDSTQPQPPTDSSSSGSATDSTRFAGSARPPLRRAYDGRMVAGVAAGLADYLAVDVTIVRVAFVLFTFVGGVAIPAYLACLLLIPEEGTDESIAGALFDSVQHGAR